MCKLTMVELRIVVGNNLRKYRLENKLTQEKIAESAGISTSYYAGLESGAKGMSLLVLKNLASSLNISADYLLNEETPDTHIRNLEMLLQGKPKEVVNSIEKLIRFCCDEFLL